MSKFVALKKFIKDQDGATLAEYAVLMAITLAVTTGALTALGTNVSNVIQAVADYIGNIPGA